MSEVVNLGKVCMTAEGNYDPSRSYDKLAVVAYNGLSWVSRKKVPEGVAPSEANSAFWQKISERGERGPQGQCYVDREMVPIVDNLTTGGSANVLSAEQGKVLKQELTELESETIIKPINGIPYTIEPTKVEDRTIYKTDGSIVSIGGYDSKTYSLPMGTSVKIAIQKDFPSSDLAVIAYRNEKGEFKAYLESPLYAAEQSEIYLTTTKDMKEIIVVGGVLEGINANYDILTKEDISVKIDDVYGYTEALPYAVDTRKAWFLDNPLSNDGVVNTINIAMENVSNVELFVLIAKASGSDTITTTSVTKCLVSTGTNELTTPIPFKKGDYIGFVAMSAIVASRTSGIITYGCYASSEYTDNPQVGFVATKTSLKINFDISYNITYYQSLQDSIGKGSRIIPKHLVNVGMSIWWMDGEPARAENTIDGEGTTNIGYQTLLQQIFSFESITKYAYSGWSLGIGDDANASIMNKVADTWAVRSNAIWTLDTITNDHGRSVPLGTTSDYDNNTGNGTFYGALRAFKNKVDSLSPNAIIVCANALYKRNTNANSLGLKLEDYGRAMCYAAAKNGWYFVDQYRYGGINEENEPYSLYDGLHPTNFGFRLAVKPWIEQFRNLQSTL